MAFIPGLERLKQSAYSDNPGKDRDPDLVRQPKLEWYMNHYPVWRSLFDGSALDETIAATQDASSSDDKTLRWPVKFNLVNAYCNLHAGMLWGRGRSGHESDDLFDIRVKPDRPGMSGPDATVAAGKLQDILQHFWAHQAHILRHNGAIQQWAGGAILKAAWNPWSPSQVYGIVLETIQPEHFLPIWDSTCFTDLLAVRVGFEVTKEVAIAKYGITPQQLKDWDDREGISVDEYWDQWRFEVVVGRRGNNKGIVAKFPGTIKPMAGSNPWVHPITGRGVIPFVYVPRVRTDNFLGDSLAYHLEGVQTELNKTLADYGDALTRGAHPAFGISDYNGPAKASHVIPIPLHGAMNLGYTKPGSNASPKIHNFPLPQVPPQTTEYVERLLATSEAVASLTPAARGLSSSTKSGVALALELLPTTNLIDWMRTHWNMGIAGPGGLNEIVAVIWANHAELAGKVAPGISNSMFGLRQAVSFRPVIPRDRLEIVDEVTRLATAEVLPPRELLRRLGDVEDIDETMEDLLAWLTFVAEKEAAVAGRAIKVSKPTNPETPTEAYPSISGKTMESPVKQPAKEFQGQKPVSKE